MRSVPSTREMRPEGRSRSRWRWCWIFWPVVNTPDLPLYSPTSGPWLSISELCFRCRRAHRWCCRWPVSCDARLCRGEHRPARCCWFPLHHKCHYFVHRLFLVQYSTGSLLQLLQSLHASEVSLTFLIDVSWPVQWSRVYPLCYQSDIKVIRRWSAGVFSSCLLRKIPMTGAVWNVLLKMIKV